MILETWSAIDDYYTDILIPYDPILEAALEASDAADLPAQNVAPNQGKFLMMLAQIHGAHSILEIGTLGGYSTIWLARALKNGGRVTTLEKHPAHAEVARQNIIDAGLGPRVDIRVGEALESLTALAAEGRKFDFVFIDADKVNNTAYVKGALAMARPGAIIIVDNVVRQGEVINADSDDESVQGTRAMNATIQSEPRLDGTAIQTVGSKGYDGFMLLRVVG